MPTQAPQRPSYRGQSRYYGNYGQARSTSAPAYDFPMPTHPRPQAKPKPAVKPKQEAKAVPQKKVRTRVAFGWMVLGVAMCFLMLYRYAGIVESNARLDALKAEVAAIEARNQALKAKIDRGLELGVLEEYATEQLGMIRPDGSQVFYIDMQLGDATQEQKEESHTGSHAIQGTPGALVHAIQVLK